MTPKYPILSEAIMMEFKIPRDVKITTALAEELVSVAPEPMRSGMWSGQFSASRVRKHGEITDRVRLTATRNYFDGEPKR